MTGALIMAGGRSERMRAGGTNVHKGLRTVCGVPLIEWNLRALLSFGFRELFVAINARESELAAWIETRGRPFAFEHGGSLTALVETEPLGTIGALASLPRTIDDVLVVNVDNLTRLDLGEFVRFHQARRAAATVATHVQPVQIPCGVLELSGERVVAYREKPKLLVTVCSAVTAFTRRAIDRIAPGTRADLPGLIETLVGAGEPVLAFAHEATWIDVNDEAALAQAERLLGDEAKRWPGAELGASNASKTEKACAAS